MRRSWIALLATTILVAVLPGVVSGSWSRVQLPDGTQVCEDSDTKTQFKPPYSSKADVTKSCNALTSFWPWLGTAAAAPLHFTLNPNPDATRDTAYPCVLADLSDCKPPAVTSLSWSTTCLNTALAIIANQSTATTTSINIDTGSGCLSGTNASSATLSFVLASDGTTSCAAQWSIAGSSPNRALTDSSPVAGSGSCKLKATYMGDTALSAAYSWLYQSPPATDSLAPPVPTRLSTTPGAGQVVISGDTPWDACGSSICKGVQDIQIQADGSGTLATVTVGPGFSCNPTTTNVGTVGGSPSATQSGNDWSIASGGNDDGSSDQHLFVNCAFSGAGYIRAIMDSFSGDATNFRSACVARRADLTATGVEAKACIIQDPSTSLYYFDFVHRDTVGAQRQHNSAIQVAAATCILMEWDASNSHTFWTATSTGGKCNNDWSAHFGSYSLGFPATSYVGLTATSNTGDGTTSTASFKQLSINNVGRWSYTHVTASSHTYGARARDKEGTPNASAYSPTVTGNPGSSGNTIKWNVGVYGDCTQEMPHGGDNDVAIGNAEYTAIRTCMDYWATQLTVTGLKGVYFALTMASFEGDTLGCYTSSCSNALSGNVAGKIGHPLIQALLDYASTKGLKVLLGVDWFHHGNYGNCNSFPKYLQHTGSVCNGTDAAGTYGIVETSNGLFLRVWSSPTMDRYIALLQDLGDTFDTHAALETVLMMTEEGDLNAPAEAVAAGYTNTAFVTQQARIQAAVKPHFPHTNIEMNLEWVDPTSAGYSMLLAGSTNVSQAMGMYTNDGLPQLLIDGGKIYVGTIGGTNFRGIIPSTAKLSDEMCGMAPAYGTPRYTFSSPQQFWDALFTTGTADGNPPLKPSHVIYSRTSGAGYCPSSPDQQWNVGSTSDWSHFLPTHPIPAAAAACPTVYAACDH